MRTWGGGAEADARQVLIMSKFVLAGVAQWIERRPANQRVTSSSPSQGTGLVAGGWQYGCLGSDMWGKQRLGGQNTQKLTANPEGQLQGGRICHWGDQAWLWSHTHSNTCTHTVF